METNIKKKKEINDKISLKVKSPSPIKRIKGNSISRIGKNNLILNNFKELNQKSSNKLLLEIKSKDNLLKSDVDKLKPTRKDKDSIPNLNLNKLSEELIKKNSENAPCMEFIFI